MSGSQHGGRSGVGAGRAEWAESAVDTTVPSVARIYDHLLGGKDNFEADREAAARLAVAIPGAADAARANRAYLTRAVRGMADAGIDQFLDLGTGIPTSPNVHETARSVRPGARTVYVDNDPVVTAHSRALLTTDEGVACVPRDLRDADALLDDVQVRQLIDFDRPVGLLMIAVLHFVDADAAPRLTARYARELAPGSRLAITAVTTDGVAPEAVAAAEQVYAASSAPMVFRTRAQFEALFDGAHLLPPGVEDVYRSAHGRVLGAQATT